MLEVPPEGVVDARGGLLWVTGHRLDEHLQGALQQHVDAAVVVVIVAAEREEIHWPSHPPEPGTTVN